MGISAPKLDDLFFELRNESKTVINCPTGSANESRHDKIVFGSPKTLNTSTR